MARRRKKRKLQRGGLPVDNAPELEDLEHIHLDAAGIDVGAEKHFVAVPEGRDDCHVKSFGTFTADLESLGEWLLACGVKTVAMESTGVYWIPLYEYLESLGLDVNLVEPSKLRNVPGRKTDVLDCQWIQKLHKYGLLEGSFRPADQICQLRSFTRQREMLVQCASQHIQHMQKALTQMNVQLHHVLTDITGQTGERIISAILDGERDPEILAKLRDKRCKNDVLAIARALQGNWREDHLFALQQAWDLYHYYQQKLAEVDDRIERFLATFDGKGEPQALKPVKRKRTAKEPQFDVRSALHRMLGVDLTSIDGIGPTVALGLIGEIGSDMSAWKTEKHFASWLALCPGNNITGGKQRRGKTKTRPSANRAAQLLKMAAYTLVRSKCALGAFLRRLKSRCGPAKAITATAHKLAIIVYNMLKFGKPYVDQGADYYDRQYRNHQIKVLARRAKQLGFQIVDAAPTTDPTSA